MQVMEWLKVVGLNFLTEMKIQFLAENSRLWWGWILIFFPIVGALIGAYELRRSGQKVNAGSLFYFVFPKHIYKSRSFRNDLIIFFSLFTIYAAILLVFAGISATSIIGTLVVLINTNLAGNLSLSALKASLPLNIGIHLFFTFLVILFYDLGFTLLHYAFHRVPFLWNLHKVHHSAEHLTPFTVARFHLLEHVLIKIFEGLTIGLIFGLFYFLLPSSVSLFTVFGLSIFGILFSSIGVFRHTHIWISYGFMNYIFCSPAMHQIHHSTEERHIDKNFSQIFSFWDYLLGSLYVPKEKEIFSVGLAHEKGWNEKKAIHYAVVHLKPK